VLNHLPGPGAAKGEGLRARVVQLLTRRASQHVTCAQQYSVLGHKSLRRSVYATSSFKSPRLVWHMAIEPLLRQLLNLNIHIHEANWVHPKNSWQHL
jgi:hypothetical protein